MQGKKRVNVNAIVPVRNIDKPIFGVANNIMLSTGDILKCITRRAIVDEILEDGTTIRLTSKNYYVDHSNLGKVEKPKKEEIKVPKAVKYEAVMQPKEVKVEEKVEVDETPVVEETPVEVTETTEEVTTVPEEVPAEETTAEPEVEVAESEEVVEEEETESVSEESEAQSGTPKTNKKKSKRKN